MTVEATSAPAPQPQHPYTPQPTSVPEAHDPSDATVEAVALAGSAAIRRIIAERNELRRERERLNGVNEELRCQNEKTIILRDHYRQIASELLIQLRQMHQAIQEASRKVHELAASENRDSGLMTLARRFAATGNDGA